MPKRAIEPRSHGLATLALNSSHLGAARPGQTPDHHRPAHLGRSPQVWDTAVTIDGASRPIALFRYTQLVLYPQPTAPGQNAVAP